LAFATLAALAVRLDAAELLLLLIATTRVTDTPMTLTVASKWRDGAHRVGLCM
jgi:hypothetical protein